jgi:hypothetical protein
MSNRPVFSPKILAGFIAVAVATFTLSLYLSNGKRGDDLGPTAYSTSALGYAGLAELLKQLNVPVVKSESNSAKKAKEGLLVVAEPSVFGKTDDPLSALLTANRVLVILPKWSGSRGHARAGWIERAAPRSSVEPEQVLRRLLNKDELTRIARAEKWPKKDLDAALETRPELARVPKVADWPTNTLGPAPSLSEPAQLMKSAYLNPLVASPEGILLGEIRKGSRRVWVLSDPDVLSNHGLGADGKRNAVFAVTLINTLRNGGPVVFDETIHGFLTQPAAPWKFIFQFPFVIVTLGGAVALALLLWATIGRFGPPDRETAPLAAGKHGLIENVARLMSFAGYQKLMLERYVQTTIRDAAGQLHAPKGMSLVELSAWLDRIGKTKGVGIEAAALLARSKDLTAARGRDPATSADVAKDTYRWKREMLNGPSGNPRDDGQPAR